MNTDGYDHSAGRREAGLRRVSTLTAALALFSVAGVGAVAYEAQAASATHHATGSTAGGGSTSSPASSSGTGVTHTTKTPVTTSGGS